MLIRDGRRELHDVGQGQGRLDGLESLVTSASHSHGGPCANDSRSPWAAELMTRRRVTQAAIRAAGRSKRP